MKRAISMLLFAGMMIGLVSNSAPAKAAKVKLNTKKKTLYVGSTYKLKVKNTSAKVKWSSSNTSVAKVSSKGKVTAKAAGKAIITAKVKKKKYKATIKVKNAGNGTKSSPRNAYKKYTFNYYEEGKKRGKFSIKLMSFVSGSQAAQMAKAGSSTNPTPASNQEYIYFKFKIKYISGSQTVSAKDLFDYYHNIYGDNSSLQMTNIDWGFDFELVDDLGLTDLSPGNQIVCSKAILVESGHSPITYKIQTGKNSYTWFTTKK
ncbi:MAG: Ig-like domain-containing protein [Eubacterium sp.]|nr:Ig-like domain-containing protein [Eubacterium sp.]